MDLLDIFAKFVVFLLYLLWLLLKKLWKVLGFLWQTAWDYTPIYARKTSRFLRRFLRVLKKLAHQVQSLFYLISDKLASPETYSQSSLQGKLWEKPNELPVHPSMILAQESDVLFEIVPDLAQHPVEVQRTQQSTSVNSVAPKLQPQKFDIPSFEFEFRIPQLHLGWISRFTDAFVTFLGFCSAFISGAVKNAFNGLKTLVLKVGGLSASLIRLLIPVLGEKIVWFVQTLFRGAFHFTRVVLMGIFSYLLGSVGFVLLRLTKSVGQRAKSVAGVVGFFSIHSVIFYSMLLKNLIYSPIRIVRRLLIGIFKIPSFLFSNRPKLKIQLNIQLPQFQIKSAHKVSKSHKRTAKKASKISARLSKAGMAFSALALLFIFFPDFVFAVIPMKTAPIDTAINQSALGGKFTDGTLYSPPSLPERNENLPDGNWLSIPKIGVMTQIGESTFEQHEEILKKGVWRVPDFADPTQGKGYPTILVAHRFGYIAWSDAFRRKNSFYNLQKMEIGDTFDVIWDKRKFTYEIYAGEEGTEITDYKADVVLYTCKYLNSPARIFRYARRVEY